jgi:hypothetical protein
VILNKYFRAEQVYISIFMKMKLPVALQFILNSFLIAVLVNTVVDVAHILTEKELAFSESIKVIIFSLSISTLCFIIISTLLYLLCRITGTGREETFWLLMIVGITLTIVAYTMFKKQFHFYTKQPGYIVAIAAFSIMVSLASQYQFFHTTEYSSDQSQKD